MRKKLFWLFALLLVGVWLHHVWLRVGKPTMTDEIRAKSGKKSIRLSVGSTAYELREGEGVPIVLVNGFSMPSVIWQNTFQALNDAGHTVLRYDLYGRGFSDRPNAKYDADLYVTQLKDLTDKIFPKQKIILCGLSMGGAISISFADKYPKKIEKLILIAPAGFPMETPAAAKIAKAPLIGDYIGRVGARRALEKSMANIVSTAIPPAIASEALQQTEYAGYADAIVSTLRHMNLTGLEETYTRVGRTSLPVLLIWGKKDKVIPFANAALVRKAIPKADFLELENAGHIPTVDEPAKTHAQIIEFLGAE